MNKYLSLTVLEILIFLHSAIKPDLLLSVTRCEFYFNIEGTENSFNKALISKPVHVRQDYSEYFDILPLSPEERTQLNAISNNITNAFKNTDVRSLIESLDQMLGTHVALLRQQSEYGLSLARDIKNVLRIGKSNEHVQKMIQLLQDKIAWSQTHDKDRSVVFYFPSEITDSTHRLSSLARNHNNHIAIILQSLVSVLTFTATVYSQFESRYPSEHFISIQSHLALLRFEAVKTWLDIKKVPHEIRIQSVKPFASLPLIVLLPGKNASPTVNNFSKKNIQHVYDPYCGMEYVGKWVAPTKFKEGEIRVHPSFIFRSPDKLTEIHEDRHYYFHVLSTQRVPSRFHTSYHILEGRMPRENATVLEFKGNFEKAYLTDSTYQELSASLLESKFVKQKLLSATSHSEREHWCIKLLEITKRIHSHAERIVHLSEAAFGVVTSIADHIEKRDGASYAIMTAINSPRTLILPTSSTFEVPSIVGPEKLPNGEPRNIISFTFFPCEDGKYQLRIYVTAAEQQVGYLFFDDTVLNLALNVSGKLLLNDKNDYRVTPSSENRRLLTILATWIYHDVEMSEKALISASNIHMATLNYLRARTDDSFTHLLTTLNTIPYLPCREGIVCPQ